MKKYYLKLSDIIHKDIHLLHIFQPILISMGIIWYYYGFFNQTGIVANSWLLCFVLICIPMLLKLANQRLLAIISTYIICGFLAFHVRICMVDFQQAYASKHEITITATISDINQYATHSEHSSSQMMLLLSDLSFIEHTPEYQLPRKTRAYLKNISDISQLHAGKKIICKARFFPVTAKQTPTDFDSRFYSYFQNISAHCEITEIYHIEALQQKDIHNFSYHLYKLRQKIYTHLSALKDSGISMALVLGKQSNITPQAQKLFQNLGIYHILSISGLHLSLIASIGLIIGKILYMIIMILSQYLPARLRIASLIERYPKITYIAPPNPHTYSKFIAIFFCLFYASLTGFSIPAIRACIMYIAGIMLLFSDFNISLIHILSLTCSLMLCAMPEALFSASFQFSFMAMFAITLLKPLNKIIKQLSYRAGAYIKHAVHLYLQEQSTSSEILS